MTGGVLRLRELTGLLDRERRLIDALRDAFSRQRSGVANGDRAAVEASVAEIDRIVSALELARGTRARLIGAITGDEALPIARLEEKLGVIPEGLRRVRAELCEAAQAAAVDAAINHAVLCRAVETAGSCGGQVQARTAGPSAGVALRPARPEV